MINITTIINTENETRKITGLFVYHCRNFKSNQCNQLIADLINAIVNEQKVSEEWNNIIIS